MVGQLDVCADDAHLDICVRHPGHRQQKRSTSTSVDDTRLICLLISIYKVQTILFLRKLCERLKEYVNSSWFYLESLMYQ